MAMASAPDPTCVLAQMASSLPAVEREQEVSNSTHFSLANNKSNQTNTTGQDNNTRLDAVDRLHFGPKQIFFTKVYTTYIISAARLELKHIGQTLFLLLLHYCDISLSFHSNII